MRERGAMRVGIVQAGVMGNVSFMVGLPTSLTISLGFFTQPLFLLSRRTALVEYNYAVVDLTKTGRALSK